MKLFLFKAFLAGFLLLFLGSNVLATPKESTLKNEEKQVSGIVTDESGEALIGATVSVKGTDSGTVTDADGSFTIAANDDDILVVSYIGYVTREILIGNQQNLSIQLVSSATTLDDVVVVAYGTQKRSDITGAIGGIDEDEFNKGVVTNPGQLLQGKVAGVNVSNVSGEPGAAQNVIIRGIGSLRSGTTPLYVIDGFVLDNTSTGVANNPLNFINPADIESIDVLKDASAAAIYGARAANGVIVITTKRGQEGKSEISVSASTAWSTIANKIDVFSADEFRRQVTAIGGRLEDFGGNTNWQDELTQTGMSNNINLSLSGAASDKFTYYASIGYQDQEGILNNSNLERYSGRLNINQTALNGRLKIDYNLNRSPYTKPTT